MRAFRRSPTGIAPPDFTVARHFDGKALLTILEIDPVKEVVQVHVVFDLTNHAVEHQKTINPDPIEDTVVLDHSVGTEYRTLRRNRVELESLCTSHIRSTDQAVGRPKQTRRSIARTTAQGHPPDNLLARDICAPRSRSSVVSRITGDRPHHIAVIAKSEGVRVQCNNTA